jgi:hypothetical protein
MTRIRAKLFFSAALIVLGTARGQTAPAGSETFVRGIEGRLPVYASTNAPRDAVAWLPGDAVLAVLGELGEALWVPVAAPDAVSVWIYRDLVRDGAVLSDKSQVRSGAGTAFRPVASLDRGTPVEVRGVFGDWLKIKPPPEICFWVLRDQVEPLAEWPQDGTGTQPSQDFYTALIEALTNAPPPAAAYPLSGPGSADGDGDAAAPSVHGQAAAPAPQPSPPPELNGYTLEDSAAQGERVVLKGTLDWGGVDAVTAPFRLVARDGNGDAVPLCNLLAPEIAYGPHIGARATVEGARWYVKGSRLPFVIPLNVRLNE